MPNLKGKDRLIVALDVDEVAKARSLVDELTNVSFFKVGWQLIMAGLRSKELSDFLESLQRDRKAIFFDLKVPDIGNTLANLVRGLQDGSNVLFLTLHEDTQVEEIRCARQARGGSETPKLLSVPFRSSLDESDYPKVAAIVAASSLSMNQWILARSDAALSAGCDGLIVSGQTIALCRDRWPKSTHVNLVSPAIRPAGASFDDHKRFTTPAQAIRLGSDYLVVGRPILNAPDRVKAAQSIIDEIDGALTELEEEPAPDATMATIGHTSPLVGGRSNGEIDKLTTV